MVKNKEKHKWHCLNCGGTRIQSLCYVWANSRTHSDVGDTWYEWADYPDMEDEYCDECIECGHKNVKYGVSMEFLALQKKWKKNHDK